MNTASYAFLLTTLLGWLVAPASDMRDEQIQVVLRDFIDLLRLHIHREESAVFDVISRVLALHKLADAGSVVPAVDPLPPAGIPPGPTKGAES